MAYLYICVQLKAIFKCTAMSTAFNCFDVMMRVKRNIISVKKLELIEGPLWAAHDREKGELSTCCSLAV